MGADEPLFLGIDGGGVRDSEPLGTGVRPKGAETPGDAREARVVATAEEDRPCAEFGQPDDDRLADAARGPGDQDVDEGRGAAHSSAPGRRRSAFFSDWACLSASIRAFARRERRRFWRRIFSASCCRRLRSPAMRSASRSHSSKRAR